MLKTIVKRLFCRHDYYWKSDLSWITRNIDGKAVYSYEGHEVKVRCAKCGKEKIIKYKKAIDKTQA